jgi:hypothetical protein
MDEQERESSDLDAYMKRPVSEPTRVEIQRLADALKAWRPTLQEFRPASPLPWIELNDESLQIQFEICDRMVSVTMPYFRERAEEMMECAASSLTIVKSAADYIAFDHQLGRVVTTEDLSAMVAEYKCMDKALPGILADVRQHSAGIKKPWWKFW